MRIDFVSALVGEKWIVFREGADLSELDESKFVIWSVETKEPNVGTMIEVGEKVSVPLDSLSFGVAYNLAFAEVHMTKVEGPKASDKPDRAFIETLPPRLVSSFTARMDSTRDLTETEMGSLKKPKPSAEPSGDSASS